MEDEHIIKLTKELIRFTTVRPVITDPNGEELTTVNFIDEINKCMDFVRSSLHKSIILDNASKYIVDASCPITIAKLYDTKKPDLLIVGHIDVVDGDDFQFFPRESSGRIYGRGSKDMKAGVAAMIGIINHFANAQKKPNIAMAFVSDEENGGLKGSNIIANKMGYKPKFVISPDPGDKHCIINKEKGFLKISILVLGKSCHPSRPWLGDCAFWKAFSIWNEISAKFNLSKNEKDWKTSASLLEMNKVFRNDDGSYSTDNSASVAGLVKCKIDIRFTEKDDVEKIKKVLKKIVKKHGHENKITLIRTGDVCYTPENNIYIRQFKQVVDSVERKNIPVACSAGASDLRFFSVNNIPCVNYGPTGKNHHAVNEYVQVNSIKKFYETIIKYINEFL